MVYVYFRNMAGDIVIALARLSEDGIKVTEQWDWDAKKWADAPHVIDAVLGFSSSSAHYYPISEQEALALIAAGPRSKLAAAK